MHGQLYSPRDGTSHRRFMNRKLDECNRNNFSEIIARYFSERTERHLGYPDNDSFRYKSSRLSTSSIILHSNGCVGINRIRRRSISDEIAATLSLKDMRACHVTSTVEISICEDSIALLKGARTGRGHFEAIGASSRLTEFVTALYAASKEWMYTYEFGAEKLSNE